MRRKWTLLGFVAALALSACSGDDTSPAATTAAPTAASANAVELRLVAFKPEQLTAKSGDAVTWTNRDPGRHTVTSGTVEQQAAGVDANADGAFDSGSLDSGASFEHTFTTPGTYSYFCTIHPATMRGTVTVS